VGLDPIATQDLYLLIDRLRQRGTSIILCSHVLPGVEAHINRAAILAKGRLQAVGSLSQLRAEAGLPVRIRASGVSERDSWLQRWTDAGHSARGLSESSLEVVAVNGHKLVLLRQLLGESEPEDIEIHQPSLEDLYRYYMERAGDVRAQEGRV
jgi:Cu-processing system ATP-binding protein